MNKEEAIEVYNGLINTKIKEAFEFFAPELRESEDEKIRKVLITYFKVSVGLGVALNGVSVKDIVAWLEKQKECSMSAEEVLTRAGLKPYKDGNQWCILAGDNIQEGICGFGDTIEDALYEFLKEVLDFQKEQKPVHTAKEMWKEMRLEVYAQASGNRHEPNYSDDSTKMFSLCDIDEIFEKIGSSTVGSQPAEWSEGDEKMVRFYENDYDNNLGNMPMCDVIENRIKFKGWLLNKLKSLRPQPKAELTLLDENIIEAAVAFVEKNDHFNCWGGIDKHTLIKALRSLKPHWKPSEEQMEALEYVIRDYIEDGCNATANYLQEILDHLKNM